MRRYIVCLTLLLSLIALTGPTSAQKFRTGAELTLPNGVTVKVVGLASEVRRSGEQEPKGPALTLAIKTPNKKMQQEQLDEIGDAFFTNFWLPKLEQSGEKYATVNVQVPGTAMPLKDSPKGVQVALLRNLHYERKEPRLWTPVGHKLPDWAKASQGTKYQLSDGKAVWIERRVPTLSAMTKSKTVGLNVRGEWSSSGSRPAYEQIRRLAAEKLQDLRGKYDLIPIYFFGEPKKEGFHSRPQVEAFVVRKSPEDFWVVQKFQFVMFTEGREKALMIWYVPSKPFDKRDQAALDQEAALLQRQIGRELADRAQIKTMIVMAIWPADEAGKQVMRYGTLFKKTPSGEWRLDSKR